MDTNPTEATLANGITLKVGQRVEVSSKYGTEGFGTIHKIRQMRDGDMKFCVSLEPTAKHGYLDGPDAYRVTSEGVWGGEIMEAWSK